MANLILVRDKRTKFRLAYAETVRPFIQEQWKLGQKYKQIALRLMENYPINLTTYERPLLWYWRVVHEVVDQFVEADNYEVKRYRPIYIEAVRDIVKEKLENGFGGYHKLAEFLSQNFPAEISVGISTFYLDVVHEIVDNSEELSLLRCNIRKKIRQETMSKVMNSPSAVQKVSNARIAWWKANPVKKGEYAQSIKYKDKMHYPRWGEITTKMGYVVRSQYEKFAHEWLFDHNVPFEKEVHFGDLRRADLMIGSIYVEIDGLKRSKEFWDERFGLLPHVIIKIRATSRSWNDRLAEQLREICEDQGYQIDRNEADL